MDKHGVEDHLKHLGHRIEADAKYFRKRFKDSRLTTHLNRLQQESSSTLTRGTSNCLVSESVNSVKRSAKPRAVSSLQASPSRNAPRVGQSSTNSNAPVFPLLSQSRNGSNQSPSGKQYNPFIQNVNGQNMTPSSLSFYRSKASKAAANFGSGEPLALPSTPLKSKSPLLNVPSRRESSIFQIENSRDIVSSKQYATRLVEGPQSPESSRALRRADPKRAHPTSQQPLRIMQRLDAQSQAPSPFTPGSSFQEGPSFKTPQMETLKLQKTKRVETPLGFSMNEASRDFDSIVGPKSRFLIENQPDEERMVPRSVPTSPKVTAQISLSMQKAKKQLFRQRPSPLPKWRLAQNLSNTHSKGWVHRQSPERKAEADGTEKEVAPEDQEVRNARILELFDVYQNLERSSKSWVVLNSVIRTIEYLASQLRDEEPPFQITNETIFAVHKYQDAMLDKLYAFKRREAERRWLSDTIHEENDSQNEEEKDTLTEMLREKLRNRRKSLTKDFVAIKFTNSPSPKSRQYFQKQYERVDIQEKISGKLKEMEQVQSKRFDHKKDLVNEESSSETSISSQNSFIDPCDTKQLEAFIQQEKAEIEKQNNRLSQRDRELKKNFRKVSDETTAFLTNLFQDVYQKSEKHKVLKLLKTELKRLVLDRIENESHKKLKRTVRKQSTLKNVTEYVPRLHPAQATQSRNQVRLEQVDSDLKSKVKEEVIRRQSKMLMKNTPKKVQKIIGQDFVLKSVKENQKKQSSILGHRNTVRLLQLQGIVGRHIVSKNKDIVYVTKIANLVEKLNQVLPGNDTISSRFDKVGNIWINKHIQRVKDFLGDNDLPLKGEVFARSQKALTDVDRQFSDTMARNKFFQNAKGRFLGLVTEEGEMDPEATAQKHFIEECLKNQQLPLPFFSNLVNNRLLLTQYLVNDSLSLSLQRYLSLTKGVSHLMIQKLYIDDCGMKDYQFAQILKGIGEQGSAIHTISYSNNEFGPESLEQFSKLIPAIMELQLVNNQSKGNELQLNRSLLDSICSSNIQLQKLKLSKMDLNDERCVDLICDVITSKTILTHLDVSWTRLTPKFLRKIVGVLLTAKHSLRSLSLSYNSLNFEGHSMAQYEHSMACMKDLKQLIDESGTLNHVDFSGMNLGPTQLMDLGQSLASNGILISAHLSDNGIHFNEILLVSLLEVFGVAEETLEEVHHKTYKHNRWIENPDRLKRIVRDQIGAITKHQLHDEVPQFDTGHYKKFVWQTKQMKTVQTNRIKNQIQQAMGIGRKETNQVDDFVMTRKRNATELIFNQKREQDLYFSSDAAHRWQLSDRHECYSCEKHKYTIIFYDQEKNCDVARRAGRFGNEDLIPITDDGLLQEIEESLNLGFKDANDKSPIIVGTVVNDKPRAFSRKLRMLRADIFSLLSVCNSRLFVETKSQASAIKNGLLQFILNGQKITQKEVEPKLAGWPTIMMDKCNKNETLDIQTVNMPPTFQRDPKRADCHSFVFADFLPPGKHQFLIWDPLYKKAFCKDVVIDLNNFDMYPEYPKNFDEVQVAKKIRYDVWKKWREDTDDDLQNAFNEDIKESFEPEIFLKDKNDIEACKQILVENFRVIQIAYIEGLAESPQTFPEVSFITFLNMILSQQKTDKEKRRLKRSQIELCFISATRGDDAKGLGGTLCRGEFMEIVLRLCNQIYPRQAMAPYLGDFIESYFKEIFLTSRILKDRRAIRASKLLNIFLYDNNRGLRMVYADYLLKGKFTFESAARMLAPLSKTPASPQETCFQLLRHTFIYSKQTNYMDLQESQKYFSLQFIEFLEFLCRFTILYFEQNENPPGTIEEQVFQIVSFLWEQKKNRIQNIQAIGGKLLGLMKSDKAVKQAEDFPPLVGLLTEAELSE